MSYLVSARWDSKPWPFLFVYKGSILHTEIRQISTTQTITKSTSILKLNLSDFRPASKNEVNAHACIFYVFYVTFFLIRTTYQDTTTYRRARRIIHRHRRVLFAYYVPCGSFLCSNAPHFIVHVHFCPVFLPAPPRNIYLK